MLRKYEVVLIDSIEGDEWVNSYHFTRDGAMRRRDDLSYRLRAMYPYYEGCYALARSRKLANERKTKK